MASNSAGRKANLKQYRAVNSKWQFVPVVKHEGKPNPHLVLIDGKPKSWKGGGKFNLEWYEDGKRKTMIAGTSPREARDAWQLKTGQLSGNIATPEESNENAANNGGIITIDAAVKKFLVEVKATKGKATLAAYARDLRWFQNHCKKHYVAGLNRDDLIALFGSGRDEGLNQKTINRRVLVTLMAARGAGVRLQLNKGDWPKTIETPVEIHEQEELQRFFAACDSYERLLFQLFLFTGFRSREVATLAWGDINWNAGTLSVREKLEFGFKPKSYEERSVPVPRALIASLKVYRKANAKSSLLFPTAPHSLRPNYGGDKPDAHMLEMCKVIAQRAGLNCGRCKAKRSRCSTSPCCKKWYLHMWRDTFATGLPHSSLDIRNAQILLGHKNIATTEKYLKALRLPAGLFTRPEPLRKGLVRTQTTAPLRKSSQQRSTLRSHL